MRLGIVLLAVLMAGCSLKRPVETAMEEGVLLLGNGPEPQALDPHMTSGTAALNIQMALYEGLVSPDPETLNPIPATAESWTVSRDGKVYRFKIRPTAKWSDGEQVTAADFTRAWMRALDPERATPYASMLYVIEGAREYNLGQQKPGSGLGVRAFADNTLEVTLKEPTPYFLSLLTHPVWYPIPSHLEVADDAAMAGSWALPDSFVGNGPFVLAEWKPNQYVEVRKNPMYWDVDTVQLEGIRFYSMDDPGAEERAFLSGQIHITDTLPPARVKAYQQEDASSLRIDPYLGTYYILTNVREGVLSDKRVRRALSLSLDKEAIVNGLLSAGQRAAAGFVPDNMPGYDSGLELEYDPEGARKLLAEAGYPGGEGFPRLEYLFNSSESHRKIAEALQEIWRNELGIEIRLVNQEWKTYLQRRESGDFELARAVWIGDYPEPSSFLDLWQTESANNWAGWSHPVYDRVMESARTAPNSTQKTGFYRIAEQVLMEDQPIIPLYYYVTVYLKDPAVKGWSPNLLDWHPYKYVSFEVPDPELPAP